MRSTLAVMTVAMLLILPAQVMAQGDQLTGIVDGEVVDADGAGLPGATATIEGENLIEASRSATSDVAGEFRFRNLRPGSYIVTVALTGFQTMAYNVRVSVGTTASVIAELELAGVSETVTVVSETPLIDIESSSLTTSYGADMLENVPVVRDFTDMTNFAPGFADKGAYGAGGNHAEGTSAHRVGSATNGYRLNGVDITENEWGTTWVNPNVDTIAEIQIVGVGASAEHSEFTGAMINLVTKGGTNEFHGSGSFYFENGSLRSDNSGGIIDLERGKYSYDREWSVTVGGPIVRNKLLFFGSIGRNETLDSVVADQIWLDGGIAVDDAQQGNDRWTMHGRVDFLLNDTNTFGFMINNDPGRETNRDLRTGSPLDVAMDTDYGSITLLLSWQSQLGDNTFTDLRFASNAADFLRLPIVCCELPDYWFNNSRRITRGFLEDEDNARKEISGTVTQYVDDFLGVAHDAKIGLQYKDSWSSWIAGYTGLGGLFTYNYYGYSYTYGSIYDIGLEGQTVSSAAFIQDDVTVTDNVTLNLGCALRGPTGTRDSTASRPALPGCTSSTTWRHALVGPGTWAVMAVPLRMAAGGATSKRASSHTSLQPAAPRTRTHTNPTRRTTSIYLTVCWLTRTTRRTRNCWCCKSLFSNPKTWFDRRRYNSARPRRAGDAHGYLQHRIRVRVRRRLGRGGRLHPQRRQQLYQGDRHHHAQLHGLRLHQPRRDVSGRNRGARDVADALFQR